MDRKVRFGTAGTYSPESLSARRAWIEKLIVTVALDGKPVALRKESVDRKDVSLNYKEVLLCRSPQGERG